MLISEKADFKVFMIKKKHSTGRCNYSKYVCAQCQEDTCSNTILMGDFNTPVSSMDKSDKKKKSTEKQQSLSKHQSNGSN